MKILVGDDDPVLRERMQTALREFEHRNRAVLANAKRFPEDIQGAGEFLGGLFDA